MAWTAETQIASPMLCGKNASHLSQNRDSSRLQEMSPRLLPQLAWNAGEGC